MTTLTPNQRRDLVLEAWPHLSPAEKQATRVDLHRLIQLNPSGWPSDFSRRVLRTPLR